MKTLLVYKGRLAKTTKEMQTAAKVNCKTIKKFLESENWDKLPMGDYDITEVSTNNTYFLSEDPNGPTTTFTITEDDVDNGTIVMTSGSLTDDVKDIKQQVKRYGFDFQKYETETMKKSSLGKGDLKDVLPDGKTLNTLAAEAPGIKDAG